MLDEAAIAENTLPNSHPIKQLKFNLKLSKHVAAIKCSQVGYAARTLKPNVSHHDLKTCAVLESTSSTMRYAQRTLQS